MKSIFCAFLFVVSAAVHAKQVPAVIQYVNCQGLDASSGATSVIFTGSLAGQSYFNVTNLRFGVPFTQQALLVGAHTTDKGLSFELRLLITNGTIYLHLNNGTNQGTITTTDIDDDQDAVALTCVSRVSGL